MTTINISIDDSLARQFNENCSKKGVSMQDALLAFIKKSSRNFTLPNFFKKTTLQEGKEVFYKLRKQAQQNGQVFSEEDIKNIIAEVRAED